MAIVRNTTAIYSKTLRQGLRNAWFSKETMARKIGGK